jgi:hypothetical protein|tara:strand:+ start:5838 stop:6062 length:225 start_codon:yes stop_codon:yes gene_type:complete
MQPDKNEMDKVIKELEDQGVNVDATEMTGLGDLVEAALTKFGVTEERFKNWFNLRECNCSKRKAWLNKVFRWRK